MQKTRLGVGALCLATACTAQSGPDGYPRYPAVFDDFDYPVEVGAKVPIDATDPAALGPGSVFGQNTWLVADGVSGPVVPEAVRAWRRYDWQAQARETAGRYQPTEDGLRLSVGPGDGPVRRGMGPLLMGSAPLGDGTYAARVRFSDVPARWEVNGRSGEGGNTMAAFWAINPGDVEVDGTGWRSELDFEWHNWSTGETRRGDDATKMHVGPIRGVGGPRDTRSGYFPLPCTAYDPSPGAEGQRFHALDGCASAERRAGGGDGSYRLSGAWVDLVFTVQKGRSSAYYLQTAPEHPYVVYGGAELPGTGGLAARRRAAVFEDVPPMHDMMPVFSIHLPSLSDGATSVLPYEVTLDADWFYYSPHFFIEPDGAVDLYGLRQEVSRLRSAFRSKAPDGLRVNTTGLPLDLGRWKGQPIRGDLIRPLDPAAGDSAAYVETGRWLLDPYRTQGRQRAVVWRSRVLGCDGAWSRWTDGSTDVIRAGGPRSRAVEVEAQVEYAYPGSSRENPHGRTDLQRRRYENAASTCR